MKKIFLIAVLLFIASLVSARNLQYYQMMIIGQEQSSAAPIWVTFGEWQTSGVVTPVCDATSTNTSLVTGELPETAANFYRGFYVTAGTGMGGGPVLITASSEAAGVNTLTVAAGLTGVTEGDEFAVTCRYTGVNTDDTYVRGDGGNDNTNFDSVDLATHDYNAGQVKFFSRFDLSGGPAASTVNSVELWGWVYFDTGAAVTVVVNKVVDAWVETAATWNCARDDNFDAACDVEWTANHGESTQLDSFTCTDGDDYWETLQDAALITEVTTQLASGTLSFSVKSDDNAVWYKWTDSESTGGTSETHRSFLKVEYTP